MKSNKIKLSLDKATELFNQSQFAAAQKIIDSIKNPGIYIEVVGILRAAIKIKQGQFEECLKLLEKIEPIIKEKRPEFINIKGIALRSTSQLEAGFDLLQKGHEQYPQNLDIAHNFAVTATDMAKFDVAIAAEKAAIQINPNYHEVYRNLGRVYVTLRDTKNAKWVFDKLNELAPECEDVQVGKGAIALIENQPEVAIPYFKRAIELNPLAGPAMANLGISHKYLGNFKKAKECLEKALLNDPGQVEHRWNLALCQLTLGELGPGWLNYECRFDPARISVDRVSMPKTNLPMLKPEDSAKGKTIILVQEQGFGDTFQFYRFAREL